ncbi:MAG TPA: ComEC/Rec2 family competence protein [Spongiibacteraceae bacterium]
MAAAGLLLLPRGIPGKGFALLLLLPLAAPPLGRIGPGAITATVIDVGQGLSVLIETAQHRLLYDTGPLFGPERTVAELTAAPLLRQRGIATLDTVIVSHHDSDHAGGWPDIEREFSVQKLLVGENIGAARAQFCSAGMQWRWDDVDFEILYPAHGDAADTFVGNNRSCVLQISAGNAHILLTGDIERGAEYVLLDNARLQSATLLLAPHHGSRSSSTAALIERLKPQFVVFSAGYRNRFGHPSAEVEQRYRASGAILFNTANDGALTFNFQNGRVVQITRQRSQRLHYWD